MFVFFGVGWHVCDIRVDGFTRANSDKRTAFGFRRFTTQGSCPGSWLEEAFPRDHASSVPHEHILITCQVRFAPRGRGGDLSKVRVWCFCHSERQSDVSVSVLRPAVCCFSAWLVRAAANSSCEVASFRADISSVHSFFFSPPQGWTQLSTISLSVLV